MSHLAHASEPIGGSPMSWTGPCDKCGRTSESCTRFREAQKPELSGKQVCTTRACQIWGGNRDEEKEAATKAAAKELKQRERDAAQALAGAAAVAAGTHVVSPRRQAQATALPADAQVQQPQPAVPLPSRPAPRPWFGGVFGGTAQRPPSQPPLQELVAVYDIVGYCRFNPARVEGVDPIGAPWEMDFDAVKKRETIEPHYLVRGEFVVADAPLSTKVPGVRWVAEDDLVSSFHFHHDEVCYPRLLEEMLSFAHSMAKGALTEAREQQRCDAEDGSTSRPQCAAMAAVAAALERADACAVAASLIELEDTELAGDDLHTGVQTALAAAEAMAAIASAAAGSVLTHADPCDVPKVVALAVGTARDGKSAATARACAASSSTAPGKRRADSDDEGSDGSSPPEDDDEEDEFEGMPRASGAGGAATGSGTVAVPAKRARTRGRTSPRYKRHKSR